LRMLAFRPVEGQGTAPTKTSTASVRPVMPPVAVTKPAPASSVPVTPAAPPAAAPAATTPGVDSGSVVENWNETVARLKLSGFVGQIANNTGVESFSNGALALVLDEACSGLLNKEREAELKRALEALLGAPLRLSIRIGKPNGETPAKERSRTQDQRQQAAVQAIQDDPTVRAMEERFGARVNPNSIRPKA
jgi:DNA polymerase III subunit gamma/tau